MFINEDKIGRPLRHFALPNKYSKSKDIKLPISSRLTGFYIEFRGGIIEQESGDRW
jgi:hypothetical protein